MKRVETNIEINSRNERIWEVITDIKNLPNIISGIKSVEILEEGSPFLGLKWKETREFFGKEATEIMWIDDVKDFDHYFVRASSHGSDYYTNFYLIKGDGSTKLKVEFMADIHDISAKIMNFLFGWMFKGATIKAFQKDLEDIKKAVEG